MQRLPQPSSERASAVLTAALAVATAMLALAAAFALAARDALVVARSLRSAREATYRAEACLAATVARIPPGYLLSPPLLSQAEHEPAACVVELEAAADQPTAVSELRVFSTAFAGDGARHTVVGTVTRSRAPYLPALAQLPARAVLDIEGLLLVDPGRGERLATIAAPDALTADELRQALAAAGTHASALGGRRRALRVVQAQPPPLDELASRLISGGAHRRGGGAVAQAAWGGPSQPELTVVDGDLLVSGTLTGGGMLFVMGSLDIEGLLDFTGIVVSRRGVYIGPKGAAAIGGGLIVGAGPREAMVKIGGELRLRQDDRAIAALDARFPLPRRAVCVAQRDGRQR